jgi:hypothetical protein
MAVGAFFGFRSCHCSEAAITLWLSYMILGGWSYRAVALDHCVRGVDDT